MIRSTFPIRYFVWASLSLLVFAVGLAQAEETSAEGFRLTPIKGGCYLMGHNQTVPSGRGSHPDGPRVNESPQHEVCVGDFSLGTVEVTSGQWHNVMGGEKPLHPERPIANVSLAEIETFFKRLNEASLGARYRLPTEAEWEYACRAGGHDEGTNFHSYERIDWMMERAWFIRPKRSDATSEQVGTKQPNDWGLYDMLGNVWEITQDSYRSGAYRDHDRNNPVVTDSNGRRVIRGGSYKSDRFHARCGARVYTLEDDPLPTVGFRLVKEVE